MVALREKITAWLFVLNSCLRASNCSRRFSSPPGRLPAAGLLFGYSSFAAGSSAGRISALTPPQHLTGHLLLPYPPWLLLKLFGRLLVPARVCVWGAWPQSKPQGWMRSPGEEEAHCSAHTGAWHGAAQPGRDISIACCRVSVACCMLKAACQGCPIAPGTLHVSRCTLRVSRCSLRITWWWQHIRDIPVAHYMLHAAWQGQHIRDIPTPCCTLHLVWWGQPRRGAPIAQSMFHSGRCAAGEEECMG